jgi:hypothetical protein
MAVEAGLYTPRGFESRAEIMKKAANTQFTVERPGAEQIMSFDRHMDRYQELQTLENETAFWKDSLEIKVKTGGFPFFVFRPLADLHLGASGTNITEVREHLKDIKGYPIYTALIGDTGDFFTPDIMPEGMLGDVMNPTDQAAMIKRFYEEYQEKILCTIHTKSHEGWIDKTSGFDLNKYLTEGLKITPLKNGGMLTLKVNDIEYKILLFHQISRYNSALNLTNAGKRMFDMAPGGEDADLVISAHKHIGAIEDLVKRSKRAAVCQLGSFQEYSHYAETSGMTPRVQAYFPTFFLDGRRKNIEFIVERESSVEWINAYAKLQGAK